MELRTPSRSGTPTLPRIAFFAIVSTGPDCAVTLEISSSTVFCSCVSGTRRLTRPRSWARSAVIASPVSTKLERDFRAEDVRQNHGRERRKNAKLDFRLREARFRRRDHEIGERGKFRAAAERRAVDHHQHRLRSVHHRSEGVVERVEKLEDAALRVFAEFDAAAERFRGRIDDDELDFAPLADGIDARGDFAQHALVQEIVFGAIESEPRDRAFDVIADELKFIHFRRFESSNRAEEGIVFLFRVRHGL